MNFRTVLMALSIILHSVLFYQQGSGLNVLLFSILQVVFFGVAFKESRRDKLWWLSSVGMVASGVSIFVNGNLFAYWMNFVSLLSLSYSSVKPGTSVFVGIFHSLYSIFGSVVFMFTDNSGKNEEEVESSEEAESRINEKVKTWMITGACIGVTLFFISLYRKSNQEFDALLSKIDLSFISLPWIGFLILSGIFMYGLYRYRGIQSVEQFDLNAPNELNEENHTKVFDDFVSVETEFRTGRLLLILLNIVILLVNVTDIVFLYGGVGGMDVDYSAMVHQGVNALIVSIICAVAIILFFFRGRLNFVIQSKSIRSLAVIWVIQNILIVISTGYRNYLYVESFLLTNKRIGVFVFLTLSVIGLLHTLNKLLKLKTNWYLSRYVGWSFFTALILFQSFDWSRIIINYNFNHAHEAKMVDYDYLMRLSHDTFPEVYKRVPTSEQRAHGRLLSHRISQYKIREANWDWRSVNLSYLKGVEGYRKLSGDVEDSNYLSHYELD